MLKKYPDDGEINGRVCGTRHLMLKKLLNQKKLFIKPILIFGSDKEIGSKWTKTGSYLKEMLGKKKEEQRKKFVDQGHLSLEEFDPFWENFTLLFLKSNPCFPDHQNATSEKKDSEKEKNGSENTASTSKTDTEEKKDPGYTFFIQTTSTENEEDQATITSKQKTDTPSKKKVKIIENQSPQISQQPTLHRPKNPIFNFTPEKFSYLAYGAFSHLPLMIRLARDQEF